MLLKSYTQLFEKFKAPKLSDWKKLTEKELKGADIDQLNQWLASDGIRQIFLDRLPLVLI